MATIDHLSLETTPVTGKYDIASGGFLGMAIFIEQGASLWMPTAMARGPFAGLQGGAVAGLLAGEIERHAVERNWGEALTVSAWFLRPTPLAMLRTQITPIHQGGRISVVDNMVRVEGHDQPCAMVRVTLGSPRPISVAGYESGGDCSFDPLQYPAVARKAPHGGPWFMDAMESRPGESVGWFRLKEDVVDGAGPLARVLGPADWAHGIFRPVANVVADPNPNLTVHLIRPPCGEWIGIEPQTHWQPESGCGMGGGLIRDSIGVIGRVAMSVALTPLPGSTRSNSTAL